MYYTFLCITAVSTLKMKFKLPGAFRDILFIKNRRETIGTFFRLWMAQNIIYKSKTNNVDNEVKI